MQLLVLPGDGIGPEITDATLAVSVESGGDGAATCRIRFFPATGPPYDRPVSNGTCHAVKWTHDGSRLLVGTVPKGEAGVLWVLDADGGEPRRLPFAPQIFHDVSLTPDDKRLVFSTGNPRPSFVEIRGIR